MTKRCPVCNMSITRLSGGGYCPNKLCKTGKNRTRLHKLKDRYITMEDKENVGRLIDRFQTNVQLTHGLRIPISNKDRMLQYISAYHLMDKTQSFLRDLNEPQFTEQIDWFVFVTEVIDYIFLTSGAWGKNLTHLSNLDGKLFQRAAPHVYVKLRSHIMQDNNDLLVIERNGNNGVVMPTSLF